MLQRKLVQIGVAVVLATGCTSEEKTDDEDKLDGGAPSADAGGGEDADAPDAEGADTGALAMNDAGAEDASADAALDAQVELCSAAACGENSSCQVVDASAVCSCLSGFVDDAWPGTACRATGVLWTETFEGSYEWSVEGGVWSVGTPTGVDAPAAHTGTRVGGTTLTGNHPNALPSVRFISPEFLVPAKEDAPRLRYWYWHQLVVGTYVYIDIRASGGAWRQLTETMVTGETSGWDQAILDLRDYERQNIQVAFRAVGSSNSPARGFYVDDVSLETGAMGFTNPQGFEAGFENWSVEGGVWTVGTPTGVDAPGAHTGTKVGGTTLTGNHPNALPSARFVSPEFLVPAKEAAPRMRYWYWHQLVAGTYMYIDIRENGGAWQQLTATMVSGSGNGWEQAILDLRNYERRYIQVAFRAVGSSNSPGRGFYIDDVSLERN